jgi:alpha-galactosidase
MSRSLGLWVLLAVGLPMGAAASTVAANASAPLAATPPMGFNNWARFQCQAQAPLDGRDPAGYGFQDFMLDQAKALVSTGLAAAGYRTVVVDDCWMGVRGEDGELHGIERWGSFRHPSSQPGFERELTGYLAALHAMGLAGGIYNTAGTTTCQRVEAGAKGHQDEDARHFARWGVDFLKLDNCGASDAEIPGLFRRMAEALGAAAAGSPHKILFDESAPAQYAPTDPSKYLAMEWVRPLGQMWRVAPDIRVTHLGPDGRSLYDPWSFDDADQGYEEGVYQAFIDTVALSRYVGPGSWNDADQLLLGDSGLTPAEERSQMGLWAVMGAPLMISADLRVLARDRHEPRAAATLATLANRKVIAVDQDPLGAGGFVVMRDHSASDMGFDVVVKPLADGGLAVLALNKNPIASDYELPLGRIGIYPAQCPLTVTELWSGRSVTVDARGRLAGHVEAHDNLLWRVAASPCLASWTPSGQIMTAQARFAAPGLCLTAGSMTVESCSANAAQRWSMVADGHIQLETGECLTGGPDGTLHTARRARTPAQRFRYHLSGALTVATGRCLAVATGTVGNGGLIGQQGAHARLEACRPYAPEQTFSAPHLGTVAP